MHTIFAIEPEAINNWSDFRYAIEKFNFSNGLLIGRYPKSWIKLVHEACKNNITNDIEIAKVVEKLSQIKHDRLIPLSENFTPGDWIENTRQQEVLDKVKLILVKQNEVTAQHVRLDDVNEDIFCNHREVSVPRTANDLAKAAEYLLRDAIAIQIIDPYFNPKNHCLKVLLAFLELNKINKDSLEIINIYSAHSKDPRPLVDIKNDYKKGLNEWTGKVKFQVFRLNNAGLDWDFHARYLLSNTNGLRFDRGFNEPIDHGKRAHLTDIMCMETQSVLELNEKYCMDMKNCIDTFTF